MIARMIAGEWILNGIGCKETEYEEWKLAYPLRISQDWGGGDKEILLQDGLLNELS